VKPGRGRDHRLDRSPPRASRRNENAPAKGPRYGACDAFINRSRKPGKLGSSSSVRRRAAAKTAGKSVFEVIAHNISRVGLPATAYALIWQTRCLSLEQGSNKRGR
jgi:hypothetical protein